MGKRSNFERKPRDFYPTPYEALEPLLPHLKTRTKFSEPCAGNGQLVGFLEAAGHSCAQKSDLEPLTAGIDKINALELTADHLKHCDEVITNPPWARPILHKLIKHFRKIKPVWFLLDADYMFTGQAAPFLEYCSAIVAVGRVSWEGNGVSGMDNAAWYRFEKTRQPRLLFFFRPEKIKKRCPATVDLFAQGGDYGKSPRHAQSKKPWIISAQVQ